MARSFTFKGFKDEKGRELINVKVEAYNADTNALLETKYTDSSGDVALTALPDDAEANLKFTWGNKVQWIRLGEGIEKVGSAPKVGFFDVTKVVRQDHIADPTGGATIDTQARTAINAILARMETYGLNKTA